MRRDTRFTTLLCTLLAVACNFKMMAKAVLVRPNVATLCMWSSKRALSSLRGVTVALANKNNYLSNGALLHVRKSPISIFNGPVWNFRRTFCRGNPISVRIGVNRTYDSTWFSYNSYGKFLSQEILLKSSLQQIHPPKSKGKAFGLRVARSILLHYPKRTSISCFVPRRPKGKKAKAVRNEKQKELKIRSQLSRKKSGARDRSAKEAYYTSLFPKQAHSQYQLHRKNQMQFTHLALPIRSTLMQSMEKKIKEQLNAESVVVKDTSGDGRHVSINAISSSFECQSAVDQMTTCTPSEASGK